MLRGATPFDKPTERGPGFASVRDPFGNMINHHHMNVLASRKG
ncbi:MULTISPECIES: hypothetical protein [unclassified Nonomuraea]